MDYIYDPTTSSGHWINLGSNITDGLTAAMDPTSHNLIRVAAKGGDNALWICDLDINTETYVWASLGGGLTAGPYIFTTSPWSPGEIHWQKIGGLMLTYTPGATIGNNTQAFVIATDHTP